MSMSTLDIIAEKIIKEQELVIGPMAWSEAGKVQGLQIAPDHHVALGSPDPKITIDELIARYERLFGRASHEVCRDAAASLVSTLSPTEIPLSLR